MYQVYILQSIKFNRFYIGQTECITNRIKLHNKGKVKSTFPYRPWRIIGMISKGTRSESLILERKLKNLNREDLIKFIKKHFPNESLASL
jgi:putative endonuclease